MPACIDRRFPAMGKKEPEPDVAEKPGFEQSLAELEETVRQLERGDVGLGQSLAHYERGVKLLRRCYEFLEKAERRIELLSGVDSDGNPVTTPVDDTSLSLDEKADARSRRRSSAGPMPAGPEDGQNDVDRSGKLF
jgi:exodeoxyribonuclease VII small subunit